MAQLTDDAVIRIHAHTTRIAQRAKSVHFATDTIARIQSALQERGAILAPSDRLTRLQQLAAELEFLFNTHDAAHLGGYDLASLRFLLTGEGLTTVLTTPDGRPALSADDAAADAAREASSLRAELAALNSPAPSTRPYWPGRI
ncbi:hypothetical protein [Microbacterium oxydans]|uniref:hypothetical protein n=1 Tax=Microbacterium oxydans TaxID=82380 RepID=UPI00226B5188|nr:hypothetical protein [Microbacterium oxydans]WAA67790.1 hypothetical protein MME74_08550 [Microbacterium oxydans]